MKSLEEWKRFTEKKLAHAKSEVAKLELHLNHPDIYYEKYGKQVLKKKKSLLEIPVKSSEKVEEIKTEKEIQYI